MLAGWPAGRRPARRGHLRWTRHGRGGRGIRLDNPGMPATASGGSPGSWDSAAGSICRLKWMRCQEDGRQRLNPPGVSARTRRGHPATVLPFTDRVQPIRRPNLHDRTMPAAGTDVSGRGRTPGSPSPRTPSPPGRRSTERWASSGGWWSEADRARREFPNRRSSCAADFGGEFRTPMATHATTRHGHEARVLDPWRNQP